MKNSSFYQKKNLTGIEEAKKLKDIKLYPKITQTFERNEPFLQLPV